MKIVHTLILLCVLLSACAAADPVGYAYIIYTAGSDNYFYCKRVDAEVRIGYDCLDEYNRPLSEYHMGVSDSWAIR